MCRMVQEVDGVVGRCMASLIQRYVWHWLTGRIGPIGNVQCRRVQELEGVVGRNEFLI